MEFSSNEILKLIERASGIPDFLSKKTDIELLLGKFQSVEEYLARFGSLDELVTFFKRIEEKMFMLKTFLTTEEAEGAEAAALQEYELLQYNAVFDKKNRSEVFFPLG